MRKIAVTGRTKMGSVDMRLLATATLVYLKATIASQKPPKVMTVTERVNFHNSVASLKGDTHPPSRLVAMPTISMPMVPASIRIKVA